MLLHKHTTPLGGRWNGKAPHLICGWCFVRISTGTPSTLTELVGGFPDFLQANYGTVHWLAHYLIISYPEQLIIDISSYNSMPNSRSLSTRFCLQTRKQIRNISFRTRKIWINSFCQTCFNLIQANTHLFWPISPTLMQLSLISPLYVLYLCFCDVSFCLLGFHLIRSNL